MAKRKHKNTIEKIAEHLADVKIYPATGEEIAILDVMDASEFDQDDNGNIFVKHATLLKTAKKMFGGIVAKNSEVCQSPEKSNNWNVVVKVSYKFKSGLVWSAVADCNKSSAPREFEQYPTALAETRASARCLRDVLGVEFCSTEEIATMDTLQNIKIDNKSPVTTTQKKAISTLLTRCSKSIENITDIIGHSVQSLDELTEAEAVIIIDELNN